MRKSIAVRGFDGTTIVSSSMTVGTLFEIDDANFDAVNNRPRWLDSRSRDLFVRKFPDHHPDEALTISRNPRC
jgi:antibiotic biosynthesis monooxygenase (ABM) superfamily enzyme